MINHMVDLIKYYRLTCSNCNKESFGTKEQYNEEMDNPNSAWRCRNCGARYAFFDDDYWEKNEGIDKDEN